MALFQRTQLISTYDRSYLLMSTVELVLALVGFSRKPKWNLQPEWMYTIYAKGCKKITESCSP